jgi:predicted DNA-binding transcriptional regulator AlpA
MDMSTTTDRLLDERQAAQMLGCSPALLRKWRLFRNGPAYCKIGRLVRYAESDLQVYLRACRVGRE